MRTQADTPNARQEDLSLIPFPVDELFSEHLPSFDAVVLQDFDAQPYGLDVNPTTVDWMWVPTAAMVKAMRTFDTVENRGYVIVAPK